MIVMNLTTNEIFLVTKCKGFPGTYWFDAGEGKKGFYADGEFLMSRVFIGKI